MNLNSEKNISYTFLSKLSLGGKTKLLTLQLYRLDFCFFLFYFSKMGSSHVVQAVLELRSLCLSLLSAGTSGTHHHS